MASSHSKSELTTAVKLLITSIDCDPKAELPFSGHRRSPLVINWNDVVDALDTAKYSFAMHRLSQPQNPTRKFPTKVAFLSLQAAKKIAFFYGDDDTRLSLYQITYDESLMNGLPSDVQLKGLPRFHLFSHMPMDLQWAVAEQLDGVGFTKMRCVNRDLRRMWMNPKFNIIDKYAHPYRKQRAVEKSSNSGGNGLLRLASKVCTMASWNSEGNAFVRLASEVCTVAMALCIVYAEYNQVCEDEDDYEE